MLNAFNNRSIRFKLLFYFLTLTLLSVLTIGFLTNLIFSTAMERSANESTVHAISQANISIDNSIRNMENTMDIISRNPQVIQFLRMKPTDPSDERGAVESNVRSFLAGFTQHYYEIEGIAIINKNDLFISNEMYKVENDPFTDEDWYKFSIRNPEGIRLMTRPVGRNLEKYKKVSADEILTIVKAVKDPATGEASGVVLIDLRIKILEYMLKDIQLGKTGFVYIVDSNGEVVYSPENYITPRVRSRWFSEDHFGNFTKNILGQPFQFIYTSSFYTKWKVIGVFSLRDTLKEVINFRYYSLLFLLIISIIAIVASIFLSSSIAKPISKLRKLMKRAESGDLSVNFDVKYNDEIGQLGNSFNTMIIEIRKLIDVVYKEQKSKREAELRILQSQIKPHFLYNTLDTIHWMVKKYGATDVIQVINALTSLFRIGLSKGNEIIRVSDEIEHVRSYLVIQKVRYRETLDYEIIADDEVKQVYVQKIILQPIVENAIYHGIKPKKILGKIEIMAEIKDDYLLFTVKDNGSGIAEEDLGKINIALNEDNGERIGYGLFNVNERIRLSYGKEYGVVVRSKSGLGTVVEIKHPIITSLKG